MSVRKPSKVLQTASRLPIIVAVQLRDSPPALGVRNQLVLESTKCVEQVESLVEPGKIDEVHYGARIAASVRPAFNKVTIESAHFVGRPAGRVNTPVGGVGAPGARLLPGAVRLLKAWVSEKISIGDGCQPVLVVGERPWDQLPVSPWNLPYKPTRRARGCLLRSPGKSPQDLFHVAHASNGSIRCRVDNRFLRVGSPFVTIISYPYWASLHLYQRGSACRSRPQESQPPQCIA